jgi:hypothetical protein
MLQKSPRAVRTATERRPAVWPWLLMPLAALALFFALRTVRHSTESGPLEQGADLPGDASAQ